MFRAIPLLAVAVFVGCGGKEPPTCEQAADHSARVIRAELGEYDRAKFDHIAPEARATMIGNCKAKPYTRAHIRCFLGSKTRAELEACDTAH